jgi:hypothetical protein
MTERDIIFAVENYGGGLNSGADIVLDLIDDGVPVDVEAIRKEAIKIIARQKKEFKDGLEAGERFEAANRPAGRPTG